MRILLAVVIAGVLGLAAYLLYGRGETPRPVVTAEAPRRLAVMTVVAALPPGHLIRPEDLARLEWPAGQPPASAIIEGTPAAQTLPGSVTRRAFGAGEILASNSVIAAGERGFLAAIVSPGMRAVAVSVDAATAAGGLIWPGDHVDLILTQEINLEGTQPSRKAVSETVLFNTRVLSTDQRLGVAAKSDAPASAVPGAAAPPEVRVPTTVTLEATQPEAERIAVAASLGKLSLALRATEADPDQQVSEGPTWAGAVSPALQSVRLKVNAPTAATPPKPPQGVRIFRGSATAGT